MQAWQKVMAAYRRLYDSRHLQADCQEPGSAPEPYALRSVIEYGIPLPLLFFSFHVVNNYSLQTCNSSHLVYLQDGMMFTYSSALQFTRVINGAL